MVWKSNIYDFQSLNTLMILMRLRFNWRRQVLVRLRFNVLSGSVLTPATNVRKGGHYFSNKRQFLHLMEVSLKTSRHKHTYNYN